MNAQKPKILDLIRPHFHDMDGYISAGMEMQKSDDILFLNANENPYELDSLENFNRYPEPQSQKLAKGLAEFYGIKNDQLLITRGADEGIALLIRLFIEPYQDSILINPPTFGVYKTYANNVPTKDVIETPLKKEKNTFVLDIEGILNALSKTENLKLIYITNPNNPTGNCFDEQDILTILEAAKGKSIVVLDETYAEFKPENSLTSKLEDYPNLIILRTLSKSFSLAGMRVGVILSGAPELITTLKTKVMEVYPVTVASVKAALHVLSPAVMKQAQNNIQSLIKERIRMEEFWAQQDGIEHVYQSDANFLLIEMKRASEFSDFCKDRNVILRDFSRAPHTENCLRISIGTPEQNDLIQKLYKEFLS